MKSGTNPTRLARMNSILDAGMRLALANGPRATTMEALAREAGIAKPTLYSYFPDKNAVYAAITDRLFEELRRLVKDGLGGERTLGDKISSALAGKHKAVFSLLEGSPHANEIYGEKVRFAPNEVAEFERWLETQICNALIAGAHAEPNKYAPLIIACTEGVARRATHAAQIGPAIRLVVEKLLA